MSRIRLGDMLVAAQMVTQQQIDEALAFQKARGGLLGEALVELGYLSEMQIAQAISNQLSVPWVNLYHIDFSRELLNLITPEFAEKFGCIPVYVRKVRQQGPTLFVATDDPTNDAALQEIADMINMPVKPMVASSSDVQNAIRVYYFGGKPLASSPQPKRPSIAAPPPAKPSIPPVELDVTELEVELPELKISSSPAAKSEQPKPAPKKSVRPAPAAKEKTAEPSPTPQKRPAKMITLTLLDGTVVTLPAKKKQAEEAPEQGLTTRDLIAALIARAEGKDVSSILPDQRWEPIMAALLSLLLRKGLIADWEFVEEWNKHRR